jgi:O-antigen/teichoic acid export membrane protein
MVIRAAGKRFGRHFSALLDQAASSLSNVAFTLIVAHILTANEFGRASILIGTCIIVIGLQRAFVTDPFLISTRSLIDHKSTDSATISGAALLVSLLFMPILVAAGTHSTHEVLAMSVALACGLPAICVADAFRMVYFRRGAVWKALVLDAIWVTVQLGSGAVAIMTGHATALWVTASWAGGALAGALFALAREHVAPSLRAGTQWILTQSRLGKPLAVDFLSGQGAAQLSLVAVATTAGAGQVANIKLVQVALGPFAVIVQGLYNSSIPLLVGRSAERQWRFVRGVGAIFGLFGTVLTVAVLLCPVTLTNAVFGDVWNHPTSIILLVGLQYVVVSYTVPHSWLLQVQQDVSAPAVARVGNGIATVILAGLFASFWGDVGAATALLFTAVSMSLYFYVRSRRNVKSRMSEEMR